MITLVSWVFLIGALGWSAYLARVAYAVRHLPRLAACDANPEALKVSVVCAVHDEVDLVVNTARSLLSIGAPLAELIVVDDRSSDGTGTALRELADPRLRVLRVDELPDGWLGKVHAMARGAEAASSELLLFVDAELEMTERALAGAVALVEERRLDHLAVLPTLGPKPYWLDVFLTTALAFYVTSNRPWQSIARRPTAAVKGVGKFNLVRRSTLLRTRGFSWLRMEAAADDIALAQLIALAGGRSLLVEAGDAGVSLGWYRSVGEMVRRLEKNTVGAFARYRWGRALAVSALAVGCAALPLGLLVNTPLAQTAGALAVVATVLFAVSSSGAMRRRVSVLAGLPVGMAFMGFVLLRSSWLCLRRGGIRWGDRTFVLEDLRAGQRARFSL